MYVAVTSLAAFAFSQIATPGPANMAMLAAGARLGFRAAFPFMFGVLLAPKPQNPKTPGGAKSNFNCGFISV